MKEKSKFVIVGNGTDLLGRGLGCSIDSHAEVVRFNAFKTAGFETDLGTRTTIWFLNRDTDQPAMSKMAALIHPSRLYVHEWRVPDTAPLQIQSKLQHAESMVQCQRVSKSILAEMTSFIGEKHYMWSTGAIAAWLMLKETDHITLANFDWWTNPAKYHYMDGKTFHYNPERGHQPMLEKRFFDRLAEAGKLHFLAEPVQPTD